MAKITGADRVMRKLQRLSEETIIREVSPALFTGGGAIKAEAQHLITQNSAGGSSGGKHQHVPSRPGEPPNEDTGNLRSHIEVTQLAPLHVEVSSNARYSAALEFGTSRMQARPFMGPAARKMKKEVVASVKNAISRAIRKG